MSATRRPPLALVAFCLFASGCASLGLEVVWSRLLKLVFGSTTLAITTILVAYMLGLGLGGLLGGRLAARFRNGVRVYGLLECAVALYALAVPSILGLYPELNRSLLSSMSFWPAAFVRFGLVLVVLLVPTVAMGMTLPVLVAALARGSKEIAGRVGLLYGANTLGAVAGVLLATFVGFGAFGVRGTNTAAALVALAVGVVVLVFVAPGAAAEPDAGRPERRRLADPLLWSYAAIGFTALAFEVAWTRALSMVLGSSIYAFATMLAGFLAGIALGSLLARRRLDRIARPRVAYGVLALALGLAALATTLSFRALPDVFLALIDRFGISGGMLVGFGVAVSIAVMLAPTLLLGALFPLVVRMLAREDGDEGGTTGAVYFANTIGSALGAFTAGFVLIPLFGLQQTLAVAIAIVLLVAGLVLVPRGSGAGAVTRGLGAAALLGALVVLVRPPGWNAAELAAGVYYRPEARLDFGITAEPLLGVVEDELLFYEEGVNTTVSVHEMDVGISLRVNGKADASLADMSTQVLSGHIPFLFGGGDDETALVIGYASGVTTGAATLHGLERVDVVEIEPAIVEASRWFDGVNHRPLERDDVELIEDDGRTWLATTDRTYDVVVSEPSNPWMTGCSNLFTTEFFAEVKARLEPGGRLLQWIQLYGMKPAGIQSILAALHEHFAYAYGFLQRGDSADLLLLATDRPLELTDLPDWAALAPAVRADLERVGCDSTADLWTLLVLSPAATSGLARRARVVNSDDNMYVELTAPLELYDDAWENQDLVGASADGVLPIADRAGGLPGIVVGELAVTYLVERGHERLAKAYAERARTRDDDAHALAVEAARIWRDDDGDVEEALALLNQAVSAQPYAFAPRHVRAHVLYETGRLSGALAECQNALKMRPGHLEVRRLELNVLAAMERWPEARAVADELLASPLVEREPRLYAEAAVAAARVGDLERAADEMQAYLDWAPYSPEEWAFLAEALARIGREPEAATARTNADRAARQQVAIAHRAALWHERFGDPAEAEDALALVLRMDPGNERARADLARVRAR